jgi:hypothetical protein
VPIGKIPERRAGRGGLLASREDCSVAVPLVRKLRAAGWGLGPRNSMFSGVGSTGRVVAAGSS